MISSQNIYLSLAEQNYLNRYTNQQIPVPVQELGSMQLLFYTGTITVTTQYTQNCQPVAWPPP